MELKRVSSSFSTSSIVCLLIVPYGIETTAGYVRSATVRLLIVPYGIETFINPEDYDASIHRF